MGNRYRGENMAHVVEYKLDENEEGNNKKEQIMNTTYTDLQKLIHAIGGNDRVTKHGLVATGQKLNGSNGEVLTKVNTFAQNPQKKHRTHRKNLLMGRVILKFLLFGERN